MEEVRTEDILMRVFEVLVPGREVVDKNLSYLMSFFFIKSTVVMNRLGTYRCFGTINR